MVETNDLVRGLALSKAEADMMFVFIPIVHSVMLKENYTRVMIFLQKLYHDKHNWICVDIKMVNFLLGRQGGFIKYPHFLRLWDSRAKDQPYRKKDWPICGDEKCHK